MTCEHCVRAVREEIGSLDGVTVVTVRLVPGGVSAVTVTASTPPGTAALATALDEAGGYRLAEASAAHPAHPAHAAHPAPAAPTLPLA